MWVVYMCVHVVWRSEVNSVGSVHVCTCGVKVRGQQCG